VGQTFSPFLSCYRMLLDLFFGNHFQLLLEFLQLHGLYPRKLLHASFRPVGRLLMATFCSLQCCNEQSGLCQIELVIWILQVKEPIELWIKLGVYLTSFALVFVIIDGYLWNSCHCLKYLFIFVKINYLKYLFAEFKFYTWLIKWINLVKD